MKTIPLTLNCPSCGSSDFVYSCEPECCFNHVCGDCLSSFQLQTHDLGGRMPGLSVPGFERDSLAPTVACAGCRSINVLMVVNEGAMTPVCGNCGAVLEIEFAVEP